MSTVTDPSWTVSRYVRTTLTCRNQPVNADTATAELIERVARNISVTGYDTETVRAILLDETVTSYPAEAPAAYAGK